MELTNKLVVPISFLCGAMIMYASLTTFKKEEKEINPPNPKKQKKNVQKQKENVIIVTKFWFLLFQKFFPSIRFVRSHFDAYVLGFVCQLAQGRLIYVSHRKTLKNVFFFFYLK